MYVFLCVFLSRFGPNRDLQGSNLILANHTHKHTIITSTNDVAAYNIFSWKGARGSEDVWWKTLNKNEMNLYVLYKIFWEKN